MRIVSGRNNVRVRWNKTILPVAGSLVAILAGSWLVRAQTATQSADLVCLAEFVIPRYPPLGRVAGAQVEVRAGAELDDGCRITQVELESTILNAEQRSPDPNPTRIFFDEAVQDALKEWRFSSCQAQKDPVAITFRFVLFGERTEDWTPTQIAISGSNPIMVEIRTSPFEHN